MRFVLTHLRSSWMRFRSFSVYISTPGRTSEVLTCVVKTALNSLLRSLDVPLRPTTIMWFPPSRLSSTRLSRGRQTKRNTNFWNIFLAPNDRWKIARTLILHLDILLKASERFRHANWNMKNSLRCCDTNSANGNPPVVIHFQEGFPSARLISSPSSMASPMIANGPFITGKRALLTHDIINYFCNATLSCAEFQRLKIILKNALYIAKGFY